MNLEITVVNEKRIDDVGPQDDDGAPEWNYSGFYYEIQIGPQVFYVRIYDNEPGGALVHPFDAIKREEVRPLVQYIVNTMKREIIEFYDEDNRRYRSIDPTTLQFKTTSARWGVHEL